MALQEGERAALEDGIEAMARLANTLRDTATPGGSTTGEIAVMEFSAK